VAVGDWLRVVEHAAHSRTSAGIAAALKIDAFLFTLLALISLFGYATIS
jgi:hypothetical protein